jgi:hypothetical protein
VIKLSIKNITGYNVNYVADSKQDLEDLKNLPMGTSCWVIDEGKEYIIDDNKNWFNKPKKYINVTEEVIVENQDYLESLFYKDGKINLIFPEEINEIRSENFVSQASLTIPEEVTYIDGNFGKFISFVSDLTLDINDDCIIEQRLVPDSKSGGYYSDGNFMKDIPNLKNVIIGKNLTKLADYLFESTSIESITLPESLIEIGKFCFGRCLKLKEINFPKNLLFIPSSCCEFSGVNKINLENGISEIKDYGFS